MIEYITTKQKLTEVSLAQLGRMDQTTYEQCVAAGKNLTDNPLVVIESVVNKPTALGFVGEMIYPIADFEWNDFVESSAEYCEYMPNVHIVEGSLYAAPI